MHSRYKHSAIEAIAIGHNATHAVGHKGCGLWHSGMDKPNVIRFNLEVDVIGMEVIFGSSRKGRHNSIKEVFSGLQVGMTKVKICVSKDFC
ncbi:hypothetical protein DSECCO2_573790 [anaerobic digester metagenome]